VLGGDRAYTVGLAGITDYTGGDTMLGRFIPVFDGKSVVGYVPNGAHKKAALLLTAASVKMEFRDIAGHRELCYVRVTP
jgi:hypothetical protein